jgi:hypothetical protein
VANDGRRGQLVGWSGGEELVQVGEELDGSRVLRFDDGPRERSGRGAREVRPRAARLIGDGEEGPPGIGLAIIELVGNGGVGPT